MKKIDMVIVTYNPEIKLLKKVIQSIIEQVRKIYIVDNTPGKAKELERFRNEKVEIIYLGNNKGIAYAQNIGINIAIENNAEYVILSDQDTVYPNNYVKEMLKVFDKYENVAAVSPLFKDINKNKPHEGFIEKSLIGFKKFYPTKGYYEIYQTIASGLIINVKALKVIGLMNEDLFIDWVDLEWCWRARKKGYKIIGNADVIIIHQLGDKSVNIGFREVNIRSPLRHYYITRNAFYLALRDNSLDKLHKLTLFLKSFRYILGFPILSKPHLKHLKYVLLGFWHGITGKLGKLDDKN